MAVSGGMGNDYSCYGLGEFRTHRQVYIPAKVKASQQSETAKLSKISTKFILFQ
jgi:hypothetical protein